MSDRSSADAAATTPTGPIGRGRSQPGYRPGLVCLGVCLLAGLVTLALGSFWRSEPGGVDLGEPGMTFDLKTTAFRDGNSIPAKYTADGQNASPPLEWAEPPAGTKSLA